MKQFHGKTFIFIAIAVIIPALNLQGKEFNIFYNFDIPQSDFAAQEIASALKEKSHSVQFLELNTTKPLPKSKNIVVAHTSDAVQRLFAAESGEKQKLTISEQAYILRTTQKGKSQTFWALGSDNRGVMYGGLSLAEKLRFNSSVESSIEAKESPYIKKRGIKFNIPLDRRTPTYDSRGTAHTENISVMWDKSFWEDYLDDLARYRYNTLSLWSQHPFPSLVKVPEYPNVALDDIRISWNPKRIIEMTIDEKIEFWQYIMKYAKNRGIDIFLFTWNIHVEGENGGYEFTNDRNDPITVDYLRQSTRALINTYPDLTGIGVTAGENMKGTALEKEAFMWNTYAQGILDAKKDAQAKNKERNIPFIHRFWHTDYENVDKYFGDYPDSFEMAFKYSRAHCYSVVNPPFAAKEILPRIPKGIRTWWNIRNDDNYIFRLGSHEFIRDYIQHMPPVAQTAGYLFGSDGYVWGKNFATKNKKGSEPLEIRKHWYSFMLWGRLGYNPETPKEVFENYIAHAFPEVDSKSIYTLWQTASNVYPLVNTFHWQNWDLGWNIEACSQSKDDDSRTPNFVTVQDFIDNDTMSQSNFINIKKFVQNSLAGKPQIESNTPLGVADQLDKYAQSIFDTLKKMESTENEMLQATLGDIKSIAHLANYYSNKIRGAVSLELYNKTSDLIHQEASIRILKIASEHWLAYSDESTKQHLSHELSRGHGKLDWYKRHTETLEDIKYAQDFIPENAK